MPPAPHDILPQGRRVTGFDRCGVTCRTLGFAGVHGSGARRSGVHDVDCAGDLEQHPGAQHSVYESNRVIRRRCVHRLQPHVAAAEVRLRRRRLLAPEGTRSTLGRVGATAGRNLWAGRRSTRAAHDASRPNEITGRTVLLRPLVDARGGLINDPVISSSPMTASGCRSPTPMSALSKGLAHGLGLAVEIFEPAVDPLAVQARRWNNNSWSASSAQRSRTSFFDFALFFLAGHEFLVGRLRTGWSKQGGSRSTSTDPIWRGPPWDARDVEALVSRFAGVSESHRQSEGGLISVVATPPSTMNSHSSADSRAVLFATSMPSTSTSSVKTPSGAERDRGIARAISGLLIDAPIPRRSVTVG